ncbi:hypothetical protein Ancab_002378 [Ancistrocladus abbreviatus]
MVHWKSKHINTKYKLLKQRAMTVRLYGNLGIHRPSSPKDMTSITTPTSSLPLLSNWSHGLPWTTKCNPRTYTLFLKSNLFFISSGITIQMPIIAPSQTSTLAQTQFV